SVFGLKCYIGKSLNLKGINYIIAVENSSSIGHVVVEGMLFVVAIPFDVNLFPISKKRGPVENDLVCFKLQLSVSRQLICCKVGQTFRSLPVADSFDELGNTDTV